MVVRYHVTHGTGCETQLPSRLAQRLPLAIRGQHADRCSQPSHQACRFIVIVHKLYGTCLYVEDTGRGTPFVGAVAHLRQTSSPLFPAWLAQSLPLKANERRFQTALCPCGLPQYARSTTPAHAGVVLHDRVWDGRRPAQGLEASGFNQSVPQLSPRVLARFGRMDDLAGGAQHLFAITAHYSSQPL